MRQGTVIHGPLFALTHLTVDAFPCTSLSTPEGTCLNTAVFESALRLTDLAYRDGLAADLLNDLQRHEPVGKELLSPVLQTHTNKSFTDPAKLRNTRLCDAQSTTADSSIPAEGLVVARHSCRHR